MSSTRNINMRAEHNVQVQKDDLANRYQLYGNSSSGMAYNPAISTFGVYSSHMPPQHFSTNHVDIETDLFGIGSTNLVKPKSVIHPDLKTVKEKSFFNRIPFIMPDPIVIEKDQRPFPA